MTDKLSSARRSANMARIRNKDTKPEIHVRSFLHAAGYRFRTHVRTLPGIPDLVFSRRRKVVFVHGCFWHMHPDPNCKDARLPKSRLDYWVPKLAKNQERDQVRLAELERSGWSSFVIWECKVADPTALTALMSFLGPPRAPRGSP